MSTIDVDEVVKWAVEISGVKNIKPTFTGPNDRPQVAVILVSSYMERSSKCTGVVTYPNTEWDKSPSVKRRRITDNLRDGVTIAYEKTLRGSVTVPTLTCEKGQFLLTEVGGYSESGTFSEFHLFIPDPDFEKKDKRKRLVFFATQNNKLIEMGLESGTIHKLHKVTKVAQVVNAVELARAAMKARDGNTKQAYDLLQEILNAPSGKRNRLNRLIRWRANSDSMLDSQLRGALVVLKDISLPKVEERPPLVEKRRPLVEHHPLVEKRQSLVEKHPPLVEKHPPLVGEHPPLVEEHPPLVEDPLVEGLSILLEKYRPGRS
jgi:hypothetical protein